jgi:hypothetical protein
LGSSIVLVSHALLDKRPYDLSHVLDSVFDLLVLVGRIQAVAKSLLELGDSIVLRDLLLLAFESLVEQGIKIKSRGWFFRWSFAALATGPATGLFGYCKDVSKDTSPS